MISKNKIKLIRSLETKKGREKHQLFVAEGPKVVADLVAAGYHAEDIFDEEDDIKKVSFLQHPQAKLGVFRLPEPDKVLLPTNELALALDGVQDPGNLGTIIRIADWFGIKHIFCSMETADCWNPKVVQATMGSIARVKLHYGDLKAVLDALPDDYPVYGTLLDGDDIYKQSLTAHGMIIMGNEGKGMTEEIRKCVNRKLFIPHFASGESHAESLNVAIATAIVCSEFRRRG